MRWIVIASQVVIALGLLNVWLLRTGKASPHLVENIDIKVSIYGGTHMRLKQLATITTPEARLIMVQPFDPATLQDLERGIREANIGINPSTEGKSIRLPVPSSVVTDYLGNGRKVILGIRPEAITDRDGADRNSRLIEIVESMVDVVEPAGSDTFVVTNIAGKEVIARMRADADVKAGTRMPFAFNLDKAVLFDPGSGLRL